MTSFNTIFKKLKTFANTNNDNQTTADKNIIVNARIIDRENKLIPLQTSIKNINFLQKNTQTRNVFVDPTTFRITNTISNSQNGQWQVLIHGEIQSGILIPNTSHQYLTWEIIFNKIQISMLPFIRVDIIYREVGDGLNGEEIFVNGDQAKIFDIKDTENDLLKRVKINISTRERFKPKFDENLVIIGQNELTLSYEAFLLITFPNPRNFV